LKDRFDIIGDVRGAGLFLGIELVRDHQSLEPATVEASFVSNRMRDRGILLGVDGPAHNVIKIRPPMPFSLADADILIEMLIETFAEL
jgi:4-aminobutyrate aminotransferase-like enzyme